MEGVHSFEKRSQTETDRLRGNRLIIANRHDPKVSWNTINQPLKSRSSLCGLGLCWPCGWFDGCQQSTTSTAMGSAPKTTDSVSTVQSLLAENVAFDSGPFPSNEWRTSKYTLCSFLPKNLFEQFRRLANFYFLLTGIIQLSIPFSPVGPFTSLAPLFFVVTTTAIKQAYEDYLRHKLDREVNNRICHVLRDKKLQSVRSKDIRVGDIVQVKNNEEIPCDMVLLATSGTGDRCYVTTANLDGETSLKSRTCFAVRNQIGPIQKIDDTLLMLECEHPNATLYEFNGILRSPKDDNSYDKLLENALELSMNSQGSGGSNASKQAISVDKKASKVTNTSQLTLKEEQSTGDDKRVSIIRRIYKQLKRTRLNVAFQRREQQSPKENIDPNSALIKAEHLIESSAENVEIALDISNLLLRASRLRNTSFVYGLVVHTGMDTKLAYNSHVKPNKFSTTEIRVNLFLFIAFLFLVSLTIISALYEDWCRAKGGSSSVIRSVLASLDRTETETMTRNVTDSGGSSAPSSNKSEYSFAENILAHFLLYNYIVPISLYVTLEFVKFFGTLAVINDKKLRRLVWQTVTNDTTNNDKTVAAAEGRRTRPKSAKTAPIKRVQIIERPKCNSSDLNEDLGQVEVLVTDKTGTLTENKMRFRACSIYGQLYRNVASQLHHQPAGWCSMMVPNLIGQLSGVQTNRYAAIGPTSAASYLSRTGGGLASQLERVSQSGTIVGSSTRVALNPRERPFDHRFVPPLSELKLINDQLESHEKVVEFFICLCLCSTITLNETTPVSDCLPDRVAPDFQSASPDEESLITAAQQFGITMFKSNEHECYIAIRRSSNKEGKASSPLKPGEKATKPGATFAALVETKLSNERFIVRRFERLLSFEFNSTRKRMSVIYRDCDNDCKLMVTKGSESVLDCIRLGRLDASSEQMINLTLAHFEAFAKSGLRTMLVAKRLVADKEYERILAEMRLARMATTNREQLLENLYRRVESDLIFVGTTAVEDTLQDGVPETIAQLKEAGIKVWLLTGDKVETAVSVAYLCKLLDREMSLLYLVRQQDAKMCKEALTAMIKQLERADLEAQQNQQAALAATKSVKSSAFTNNESTRRPLKSTTLKSKYKSSPILRPSQQSTLHEPNSRASKSRAPPKSRQLANQSSIADEPMFSDDQAPRFALIVDGRSLHYAMKYAQQELEAICRCCICVLGCRLSPLQKAEVVSMIKSASGEPITAAIGDGANDVSMIQEAHVGIGIMGKEGRQAVNSCDFAIKRFHMLNRLFFVHGHFFYHRTANTIHFFFYKNLLFILPQFLFSFYSNNREKPATSIYHPIMLITFNLLFTSLPILMYGLLERHLSESSLESEPKLYRVNRQNSQLRTTVYLSWMALSLTQGSVAYYWLTYIWGKPWPIAEDNKPFLRIAESEVRTAERINAPPTVDRLINFSIILFCAIVFTSTIKLYLLARYRNKYFNLAALISILALPLCFYIFSIINWMPLLSINTLYYKFIPLLSIPMFWLALFSTVAATTVPDIIFTYFHG